MSNDLIAEYGLTPTQNAAVCEYLRNGFNKKKAAELVGCGSHIFNDPRVINAVADSSRAILADTNIRAVAVVEHLSDIIFANVADYFDWKNGRPVPKSELTREQLACVSELKQDKDGVVTIKLHDKNKAIDQISKLLEWTKEQAAVNIVLSQKADDAEAYDSHDMARRMAFMLRDAAEKQKNITDIEVGDGDS